MADQLKLTNSETVVAVDSNVIHNSGVETISGAKVFTDHIQVGNSLNSILVYDNRISRLIGGSPEYFYLPSDGGTLATEDYVDNGTTLFVSASYSGDYRGGTLSGLSRTYDEMSAALYGGRNVVLEVDPGENFASLDKMVFQPVRVDSDPHWIHFISFSDPDDDGWFWALVGPGNWNPVSYQSNVSEFTSDRLVCRQFVTVDVSELPDIVIDTTYDCFQRYYDNLGKVPVLVLEIGDTYVHLVGSSSTISLSQIVFHGVFYADLDGSGDAPWLLSVSLESPLEDGDPDRWTVTTKKFSDVEVFTVNADLSLSTMTISNADKTLADALAAVASGGVVRLVLNGTWNGWAVGVFSNSISFSIVLFTNFGGGDHPYVMRANWSNDGDADTWDTTVEELATTSELFSGDYNDLSNKPTIPTVGTLNTTASATQSTNASESLSGSVILHKVSKTGSYNDLLDKPSIQAPLTFDNVPTSGSDNPVKSNGIKTALDGKADALHTHSSIESPNGAHALELSNSGIATITGVGAVTAHDATYSLSSLGSSFNGVTITVRWPLSPSSPDDGEVVGSSGISDPSYSGGTIFSGGDYFGEIAGLADSDALIALFFIASISSLTPPITPSISDVAGPATVQTDANLVTVLTSAATDAQYASAKCIWDIVGDIELALSAINNGTGS